MATRQDSTHPTGVADDRGPGSGYNAGLQRTRKADAALSLRLSGATWSEIAQAVGYPTPRQAMLAVERSLIRQLDTDEDREKMRRVAGARLERLLRAVWGKAINPADPEQMVAQSRARENIDRYIKLYGLDAPTEMVVHTPSQNDLEDWVLRMTATLVPEVEEPDIFEAEVISIEQVSGT